MLTGFSQTCGAGGWRFASVPEHADLVERSSLVPLARLSQAAGDPGRQSRSPAGVLHRSGVNDRRRHAHPVHARGLIEEAVPRPPVRSHRPRRLPSTWESTSGRAATPGFPTSRVEALGRSSNRPDEAVGGPHDRGTAIIPKPSPCSQRLLGPRSSTTRMRSWTSRSATCCLRCRGIDEDEEARLLQMCERATKAARTTPHVASGQRLQKVPAHAGCWRRPRAAHRRRFASADAASVTAGVRAGPADPGDPVDGSRILTNPEFTFMLHKPAGVSHHHGGP